jgi:tRNA(fMet)-specific endonuclease VapC
VSTGRRGAVVVDTMAISALANATRNPELAAYRQAIAGDRIVVSFATVTELRYGALRAGWGELRRRGLERDLAQFVIAQPDDQLMRTCAELRVSSERAGHGLGHKIHEADRWIAATAIRLDIDLVSDDSVFRGIPGLPVRTLATP